MAFPRRPAVRRAGRQARSRANVSYAQGLAPIIVREIGRIVQGLKGERLSILLVEQNYHLALRVADRVYVMNKGQIVWEGTPAGLEADEDVKRRYLGVA